MKRFSLTILILMVILSTLAIGAQNSNAAEHKPKIGVIIFDYSNQYVTYIRNSIRHYGGDEAELQMVNSMNNQSRQNEQVDTMLMKGVDALLVNLVYPASASTIIEKVRPFDIPLIFFNKQPSEQDMLSYDKAYYSGCNPYDGGIKQAEMALTAIEENPDIDKNNDGKIQYVIIRGEHGHPDAEESTQAYQDLLGKQTDPSFELLDVQTGNWVAPEAKDKMESWIGRYGEEMELLLTNSDAMTLGAVEALKGAGWFGDDPGKQMLIVGHDAIPETQPLIKDGTIYGAILQDAVNEGRAAIRMGINLATGQDVEKGLEVPLGDMKDFRAPFIKITEENVDVAKEIYDTALGN